MLPIGSKIVALIPQNCHYVEHLSGLYLCPVAVDSKHAEFIKA